MQTPGWTTDECARHWDSAFRRGGVRGVSWYQDEPRVSLELMDALGVRADAAVIDVGGGASMLVDRLVARGFDDVTVFDISVEALAAARRRLGRRGRVSWLCGDLLIWRPQRRFDLWHDRAVLHFLIRPDDREAYLGSLRSATRVGAGVIIAAFSPDGPEFCSGLPVARYSAEDLAGVLGSNFEMVESRREQHTTPDGAVQPFTWIAGRLVGRQ